METANSISNFVKYNRNKLSLTQEQLAEKAGVGLRFIRDLEQGKETLRLDKVNQVLSLFSHQLAPGSQKIIDPYEINLKHFNRAVKIEMKDKTTKYGFIIGQIMEENRVTGWKFVPNNNAIRFRRTKNPKEMIDIQNADIGHIENIN